MCIHIEMRQILNILYSKSSYCGLWKLWSEKSWGEANAEEILASLCCVVVPIYRRLQEREGQLHHQASAQRLLREGSLLPIGAVWWLSLLEILLHCFQIWPKICLLEEKDKQGLSESQHNPMPIPYTWAGTCEPFNIKEEVNPHCRSFGALGFIQNAIHYVKKYKIQKMNWNHRYLVVPVCFSIHTCSKFSV